QKGEHREAQRYLEKAYKLDPKNPVLALQLAALETRARHLDRAEAILRQGFQANPSSGTLAFFLAENLIAQGKVEGTDQANHYMALLRGSERGEALVRYLEAKIPFQQKQWDKAIAAIEKARVAPGIDRDLMAQLDYMQAECYRNTGAVEERLEVLRRAAAADRASESVRMELVRNLAHSGKLDQAVTTLMPLAVRNRESRLQLGSPPFPS